MGAYHCGVTPESQERNPFVSIAVLVAAMALAAGLAARFGLNNAVAAICVVIAVMGTWLLLAPQVEVLEPALGLAPGGGQRASADPAPARGKSKFSSAPAEADNAPRQQLRGTPRVAVGFDTGDSAGPGAAEPARLASFDDSLVESVAPVQALGQLPQEAAALAVSTTVEPASNISGAYTLGKFEIRAASRRGSDNTILNDPRQDDFVVASAANGRYLVIVVADGVNSAENSHYGSYWACRLLAQAIDHHLREGLPGIERMLDRTREEVSQLFDLRFTDGTKMRTIATTLVGLIAPVDGGPAAGFRVGPGDIVANTADGWTSVFAAAPSQPDSVFPRDIAADVAPLEFDANCLLLTTDGVGTPLEGSAGISTAFAEGLQAPLPEVEFDQLLSFPLEEARGDRTAVGVWFEAPR